MKFTDRFGRKWANRHILRYHNSIYYQEMKSTFYSSRNKLPSSFFLDGDINNNDLNGHANSLYGPAKTKIMGEMVFTVRGRVVSKMEWMLDVASEQ